MNHWPVASSSSSSSGAEVVVVAAAAAASEDEPLLTKRRTETTKMGKAMEFIRKLETEHEPGLTNGQLMLTNHDLKPGNILISHICFFCYWTRLPQPVWGFFGSCAWDNYHPMMTGGSRNEEVNRVRQVGRDYQLGLLSPQCRLKLSGLA